MTFICRNSTRVVAACRVAPPRATLRPLRRAVPTGRTVVPPGRRAGDKKHASDRLRSMLIESQAPETRRRFTAPRQARPAPSAIDKQIIQHFVAYQHEATERVRPLEGRDVPRITIVSAYVSFVTSSVLKRLSSHRHASTATLRAGTTCDAGAWLSNTRVASS